MNKKTRLIDGNKVEYYSMDELKEFNCSRCGKMKKSKKYAKYIENGVEKIICNACYGEICSK